MKARLCLALLCVFGMMFSMSCGGGGSSSTPGTPNQPPQPPQLTTRVPFLAVSGSASQIGRSMSEFKRVGFVKDGRRLAYSSPITTKLMSVRTDGTDQKTITTVNGWFDDVSMTPDSKSIVFMHYPFEGLLHIDRVDVDGTNNVQLSDGSQNEGWPVVTPKGDKIYYTDMSVEKWQLYRMNLDGTGKEKVLNLPTVDQYEVNISPDGTRLVLDMNSGDGEILGTYVVNADGTNLVKILNWTDVPFGDATFSPDGQRILFTNLGQDEWFHIMSVDLTGGDLKQMTTGPLDTAHPLVFGDRIVYMRALNDIQLFATDKNWTSSSQITTGPELKTFHVALVLY